MRIIYHHRTRAEEAQGLHILEMVNAFRELGHEVEIVSLVRTERPFDAVGNDSNDPWWKAFQRRLPLANELTQLAYNLLGIALLMRCLRKRKADFIYERYSLFNFAGVFAAWLFRIPLVLEVNSPLGFEMHQDRAIHVFRFANWMERRICNAASLVIVVSTPLRRILAANGVAASKILVLTNGVNATRLRRRGTEQRGKLVPGCGERVVIGFVGWFREWHGLELLIDAFHNAGLRQRAVLVLVGDGPIRARLEELVCAHSLEDSVLFTGALPPAQVGSYVQTFDIAVQPAANPYCCPMKIIEYMALGKAIVAPRQENMEELLEDGDEALFFAPQDTEDLGSALAALVNNPELRALLGRGAARAVAERPLSWTRNAQAVIDSLAHGAVPVEGARRHAHTHGSVLTRM